MLANLIMKSFPEVESRIEHGNISPFPPLSCVFVCHSGHGGLSPRGRFDAAEGPVRVVPSGGLGDARDEPIGEEVDRGGGCSCGEQIGRY